MTVEFDPPRPGADGKPRERKARLVREKAKAEGNGLDAASGAQRPKFPLIPFNKITFATTEEWLVKKLLPRKGVGAFYGASGSAKTFILVDLGLHVSLGWPWAARRVTQAPVVYIAAEGADGLKKRIIGWKKGRGGLPVDVPFFLIEVAPNLGAGEGDLKELITCIESAGVRPGLIGIDTVSQSIGTGDENGAGMVQFAANATALANHFDCLVAPVHHVGLGDDKRLRGHTSFIGALDASVLCERKEGEFSATLTVMKLKDEESGRKFTAHLVRVVIGQDEDGDDVSTLVVESVEAGAVEGARAPKQKSIPASLRMFAACLSIAIDEAGEMIKPFADGPAIKAAPDDAVRNRYFKAMAEQAEDGEDPKRFGARQRLGWHRATKSALEKTIVVAGLHGGRRFIWFK
jgi:AAA domain